MNLLENPWIPVRAKGGAGEFHLLTYRQVLCESGDWQVSLPRDDLELACLQLLVCMTQVMFLPENAATLRERLATPLTPDEFTAGIAPCRDWFDLDHPTQPFMQSNKVIATKVTPIQKLLVGLPEGNNHAFFNETGEVRHLSGVVAAIALFNQASNAPNWSGKYKGGLRGGAPITTLVFGSNLREVVWRNVLTRPNLAARQIAMPGLDVDLPTWVKPITADSEIPWNTIGLVRGLFWQPILVKLVKPQDDFVCGVLGGHPLPGYFGFRAEPDFKFSVGGVWPHPHGVLKRSSKNGSLEEKFASFRTTSPAWTLLTEFVVPRSLQDGDIKVGTTPAGAITQASELDTERLSLLVGGYCAKQASILERRHELMSLAKGWRDDKERLPKLVAIAKAANNSLLNATFMVAFGAGEAKGIGMLRKKKGRKAIRTRDDANGLHDSAEKLFYARTESLIHQTFSNTQVWKLWATARTRFAGQIAEHCRTIFEELTQSYAAKPELIPVIAWARRSLNVDLKKLTEEA